MFMRTDTTFIIKIISRLKIIFVKKMKLDYYIFRKNKFLFIMSYISYFSFTLWTSEALLISYFSTLHFYFSTLHFHFSTLVLFFYIAFLRIFYSKFFETQDLMQVQSMGHIAKCLLNL